MLSIRTALIALCVVIVAAAAGVAIASKPESQPRAQPAGKTQPQAATTAASRSATTAQAASGTKTATAKTATVTARKNQPAGVPGAWKMIFSDEFNGTSLNTSKWSTHNGWKNQNGVTDYAKNISVTGGNLVLQLSSPKAGAEIETKKFAMTVGMYVEARIRFAGSGTQIDNWPAWWTSGPNWPQGGESDIAEGFGTLTVSYHSPAGNDATGTVPGKWAGAFHTYGMYRGPNFCAIVYDGKTVRTYSTHDNGAPENLLFTIGAANKIRTGLAGAMEVNWVRVWIPAGWVKPKAK